MSIYVGRHLSLSQSDRLRLLLMIWGVALREESTGTVWNPPSVIRCALQQLHLRKMAPGKLYEHYLTV